MKTLKRVTANSNIGVVITIVYNLKRKAMCSSI